MSHVAAEARATSEELAAERGVFPASEASRYAEEGVRIRNATCTSVAPTGTIGILAGTSAGIEPLFALAYRREHVLDGATLPEVNPLFVRYLEERAIPVSPILDELLRGRPLSEVPGVPSEVAGLFRTALGIAPEDHLRIQAAFQRHVDNAVSKTINLPHEASPADVASIYHEAWERGLKGITVYRYGSKSEQVLNLGVGETSERVEHFSRCDPDSCDI